MGSIFIIQGILIYIYAFDHNPPHIHVKSGDGEFTITIKDRIVEGKAKSKTIQLINSFMDMNLKKRLWKSGIRLKEVRKLIRLDIKIEYYAESYRR